MAISKINCNAEDVSWLVSHLPPGSLDGAVFVGDGVEVGAEYRESVEAALEAGVPDGAILAALKTTLYDAVDRAAEQARRKYITAGAGQAMTYVQKADEAKRFLAAEDPQADDYPLLAAEIGITGPEIGDVAAIVSIAHQNWQQIGAAIEASRLGTKKAIDEADSEATARAAAAAVMWP